MRRTGRAWTLAGAFALLIAAPSARASAASLELAWSTPPGCPTREAILEATRARLNESGQGAAPELFVRGIVTPRDGGFQVTLVLTDAAGQPAGERELRVEGDDCAAIQEPVSLVLALVIAAMRPHDPGRAVARPDAAEAPRPPSAIASPAPPPRQRLLLGAAALGSYGVLPTVGFGAAIRAMYSPGWRLFFGLEAGFEIGDTVQAGRGEVAFQLFDGVARVGLQALHGRQFELIPTLGIRAGVIHAPSTGYALSFDNETRAAVFGGPGLLARVELAPRVFLEIFPEVEAIFIRDDFQVTDEGKLYGVHRAKPVDVRMSLGIGYEFR